MEPQLSDRIAKALTWVALVFAAGFIGYFGRYASKLLLARLHKRKPETTSSPPAPERPTTKEEFKLAKKRRKADQKKAKKAL